MNDISKAVLFSQIRPIEPGTGSSAKNIEGKGQDKLKGLSFDEILFSKHAEKRLQSRQIELSEMDKLKLEGAMNSLEKKGAKDSLVLMGELAFIVNVPSKTVVTALSKDQMKEQIFTNIDSTIFA